MHLETAQAQFTLATGNAFNPHFARMHLETTICISCCPRSESFNPHFARMHLETRQPLPAGMLCLLSILILRGCILKQNNRNIGSSRTKLSILILRGCILKLRLPHTVCMVPLSLSILILRGCILKRRIFF